jgi:hypothetical protein
MSLVRPDECRRRCGDRVVMSAPAASTGRSPALGNEVEAIEIHHLVPRSDEVTHKLLCGIGFGGGQCLSLADFVTVMGPADGAPTAGGC